MQSDLKHGIADFKSAVRVAAPAISEFSVHNACPSYLSPGQATVSILPVVL